jgi:hypothetical protein
LDIDPRGDGTLTIKVANGAGGYDPGALIENTVRPVTAREVASFLSRVRNVGYRNLPTVEKTDPNLIGCDGSRWIIEGVNDGRYHIVDRWTPGKGPIHKLGSHLAFGLARLKIPKRELY